MVGSNPGVKFSMGAVGQHIIIIISFIHTAHFNVISEHIGNDTIWEIVILEKCKLNRQAAITYMEKYSQEFNIHASSQISRF